MGSIDSRKSIEFIIVSCYGIREVVFWIVELELSGQIEIKNFGVVRQSFEPRFDVVVERINSCVISSVFCSCWLFQSEVK